MTTAPMKTTTLRASAAFAAAGIMLGMLAGCSPADPEPTPTKTELFASEEEAFAAAEETYRAYVAAGNDSTDALEPSDFLIGLALENHIDAVRALDEADLRVEGITRVSSFEVDPDSVQPDRQELAATVCLDISNTRTLNGEGKEVTPANRANVIAMRIEMKILDQSFVISRELDEENQACDV